MKREKNTLINKIPKKDAKPIIQKNNEDSKQNDIQNKSKNDILKVLIYIYYYEKNILNIKSEISFNIKEKYYIINHIWINELKNYYNYQTISKILDRFSLTENGSNIQIDLSNLENNNILNKIKIYLNKCNINLLNKQPNANLKNSNMKMLPIWNKNNNFVYYSNAYIINSKILEITENYMFEGQKIEIKSTTIFNKENSIFVPFIDKKKMQFL